MSSHVYIEVVKPGYNKPGDIKEKTDESQMRWFKWGSPWSYNIAVAGGYRTYSPPVISNDPVVMGYAYVTSGLECALPIKKSLQNYQIAIEACKRAIKLEVPILKEWLQDDLRQLEEAQAWFQKMFRKMPEGIVRLDWSECAWDMDAAALARESLLPTNNFKHFTELASDCESVESGKLSLEKFVDDNKNFAIQYEEHKNAIKAVEALGDVKF